jgi:hypothetical protein
MQNSRGKKMTIQGEVKQRCLHKFLELQEKQDLRLPFEQKKEETTFFFSFGQTSKRFLIDPIYSMICFKKRCPSLVR